MKKTMQKRSEKKEKKKKKKKKTTKTKKYPGAKRSVRRGVNINVTKRKQWQQGYPTKSQKSTLQKETAKQKKRGKKKKVRKKITKKT